MKNQLFKVIPDKNITLSLLNLFGIHDFNDNHSFTKLNLIDLKTVDNINKILNTLQKYYIPCKYNIYVVNLNEKKCITILRQFHKIHNHTLFSKEKYNNGKKLLYYQVIKKQINIQSKKNDKIILSFD